MVRLGRGMLDSGFGAFSGYATVDLRNGNWIGVKYYAVGGTAGLDSYFPSANIYP